LSSSAHSVRFGPFRLDLCAAELHYNGSKVKLAEQPFQILAELVQHPGEVVTREDLLEVRRSVKPRGPDPYLRSILR